MSLRKRNLRKLDVYHTVVNHHWFLVFQKGWKEESGQEITIFYHCNRIKFHIESKVSILPIVQMANIFTKFLKE